MVADYFVCSHMKQNFFLIKLGKVWSTLRRDGIARGSMRVLRALGLMLRPVQPGEVLFITGGAGDSARYRTDHVAEALGFQGVAASVTMQSNPFLQSYVKRFSVFVFHRVLYTPTIAAFIARIEAAGKEIIFETDDLVYDPAFLKHMDYFQTMNRLERKLYEHGLGGEILANPYVKVCTTSTGFLAAQLRKQDKRVIVVKNVLSVQDVHDAEIALKTAKKDPSVVRLAYFSGTPSHNKDFATITPVIMNLLTRYPTLRLVLAGPLDVDDTLNQFASQIERVTFAPRAEHLKNIARVDINLAPLEIDNPFCESKSELKWFEAGIVAVPTVAAATLPYKEAITDGVDGFVAATTEEWQEKLERLITNPVERIALGERARQMVLSRYTTKSIDIKEYSAYINSKIVQS